MSHEDIKKFAEAKSKEVGHKVGMNRRDLLAHGFWSSAAMAMVPTLPALFAKTAFAGCDDAPQAGLPAFLAFDMAGGAALAGSVLVGKRGGPEDLLQSYNVLGWDPRVSGALDKRFGLPMSAQYSTLLAGMLTRMSADAQARLRLGSVCHFSQLDTQTNKMNAASLAAAAGSRGTQVSKGFGTASSRSGGNSETAYSDDNLTPVFVRSVDDIIGSARFGGTSLAGLTPQQLQEIALRAKDLSMAQREAIRTAEGGELLYELTKCTYEKNMVYASGASQLDPRQDAVVRAAFGIAQGSQPTDPLAVAAGVLTNSIKGFTGPATWTLADCDYHVQSNEKGDLRDREMGEMIGRAVEFAHRSQKPLFFELITDGSCSASMGTRNWNADTNEGVTIFGYYDPAGAPRYKREGMCQIGAFTDGQGADRSTPVGGDALKSAYAVFANYCNLAGKMSEFTRLVPDVFSPAELESMLIFEGRPT